MCEFVCVREKQREGEGRGGGEREREREGGREKERKREKVKSACSILKLLDYLFENSVDPFMAYFSYFVKSAI